MPKTYVIDCNVIIKWFFNEEDSSQVDSLYDRAKSREIELFAPSILELEFLGILTKLRRSKNMKRSILENSFSYFLDVCQDKIINLVSMANRRREVFLMSLDNNINYFDAEYLYLSKILNAELITFDKNLKKKQSKI